MSNDQINFDEFMAEWEQSTPTIEIKNYSNNKSNYRPDDGHEMWDQFDILMPQNDPVLGADKEISTDPIPKDDGFIPYGKQINIPEPTIKYRNIWEFLKANNFPREIIDTISLTFDNINNVVKLLEVTFVDGNVSGFENIQLEDK